MEILKYEGGISYEGFSTGTRVNRFWFINAETVLLDLTSQPMDEKQPKTRFLGVAEKRSDGKFETPWVYLMNPEGGTHIDGSAYIGFHIAHHDDEIVRIIGTWTGEDESVYKFDCNLCRLSQATVGK